MKVMTCDEFSIMPRLGMERLHTRVSPTSTVVLNAENRKEDSSSLVAEVGVVGVDVLMVVANDCVDAKERSSTLRERKDRILCCSELAVEGCRRRQCS